MFIPYRYKYFKNIMKYQLPIKIQLTAIVPGLNHLAILYSKEYKAWILN